MFSLQNLEINKVSFEPGGISAFASPPGWHYEYDFFIRLDGTVIGKAGSGEWLELEPGTSRFIYNKVKAILSRNKPASG